MKMTKAVIAVSIAFSTTIPLNSLAENAVCGAQAPTLLSVSDFNGDGNVNGRDISLLAKEIGKGGYFALYDRNSDGVLDNLDVTLATQDINRNSSQTDQQLAQMYQRFKHFQDISEFDQLSAMGYQPLGGPLAFHGQHWMNQAGQFAIAGLQPADPNVAEGLNVASDGSDIPALFWGSQAIPLFEDATAPGGLSNLDWASDPFGLNPNSAWQDKPVQAFANTPPDFFDDTEEDAWHKHAGVCLTFTDEGAGPHWNIDQHTSNAFCQSLPNLAKFDVAGQQINLWGNFWMLHVWLYDLNPNGTFANTHPCIDPDAASEDEINGGRVVPPFFQDHHG